MSSAQNGNSTNYIYAFEHIKERDRGQDAY